MDEMAEMEGGNARAYIGGDPSEWTPGQRTRNARMAAFIEVLEQVGSMTQAYQAADIPETTVLRWRKDYPKFAEAVDKFLTETRVIRLEESMYAIATSTDPKAASAAVKANEFLLRSWGGDRYNQAQRIEQTTTVNHMVQVIHEIRDTHRERQAARLARLKTVDAEPSSPNVKSDTPQELTP